MVDTVTAYDDKNRPVEVEVGVDGVNPVSPNNPPAKAVYVNRRDLETPDGDESKGVDGENVVSPNNPPENTQTVSSDVYGGAAPEGVDEAVAEAASNEQYPVSYQPVKPDVKDGEPFSADAVQADQDATADSPDEDSEDDAPAKSALKEEWVDYAVKQGADREEAEASTKDELIEKYGN